MLRGPVSLARERLTRPGRNSTRSGLGSYAVAVETHLASRNVAYFAGYRAHYDLSFPPMERDTGVGAHFEAECAREGCSPLRLLQKLHNEAEEDVFCRARSRVELLLAEQPSTKELTAMERRLRPACPTLLCLDATHRSIVVGFDHTFYQLDPVSVPEPSTIGASIGLWDTELRAAALICRRH